MTVDPFDVFEDIVVLDGGLAIELEARRGDISWTFLAFYLGALAMRLEYLGQRWAVWTHQLESGALLLFAFFMISDPRTAPDSRLGRLSFAFAVALFGHYLAFFMQMRPALYVALIVVSPLTLLIDKVLPARRFQWREPAIQGAPR